MGTLSHAKLALIGEGRGYRSSIFQDLVKITVAVVFHPVRKSLAGNAHRIQHAKFPGR